MDKQLMTPIGYLRQELNGKGDFIQEYKPLGVEDKEGLKKWAVEEMDLLGIRHT